MSSTWYPKGPNNQRGRRKNREGRRSARKSAFGTLQDQPGDDFLRCQAHELTIRADKGGEGRIHQMFGADPRRDTGGYNPNTRHLTRLVTLFWSADYQQIDGRLMEI